MTNDDSDLAFDRRTVLQLAGGSLATLGGVGTAAADTGEVIEPEVKEGSGTLAWITPEDPVSKGAEVTFSGKHSSDPEGEIEGYEWTVYHEGEEVATGTGETYSYTFEEVGDYEIFLLVDGPSGFAGSSWEWTIVDLENRKRPLPAVDFGGEQLVAITRDPEAKTELDAGGSLAPDGASINDYTWRIYPRQAANSSDDWYDFFDGEAPIYKFPFGGKYHIQIELGTSEGQSTIRTFEKEVIGPNDRPPQVQVDWPVSDGASVSRGTGLSFNVPRAVDPDGGDVDVTWYYLGDQWDRIQSHFEPELTLTPTETGSFDVWVQVDDDEGQTWESEHRSITVEPGVLISFENLPETIDAGKSADMTINLDASDEIDVSEVAWYLYAPDGTQIDNGDNEFAESISYTTPTLTKPGEYELNMYAFEKNGSGESLDSVGFDR